MAIMVVASSSRIWSSLQMQQSTLVAGWKVRSIFSVNVPAIVELTTTTSNSKTTIITSRLRITTESRRRRHDKICRPRAEKRNEDGSSMEDDDGDDDDSSNSSFLSMELLLQMAIIVFTIGFIDAGYSGDWSRIGALSKEKEELLRIAAYGVVPLSAAAVWAIRNQRKSIM